MRTGPGRSGSRLIQAAKEAAAMALAARRIRYRHPIPGRLSSWRLSLALVQTQRRHAPPQAGTPMAIRPDQQTAAVMITLLQSSAWHKAGTASYIPPLRRLGPAPRRHPGSPLCRGQGTA